MRRTPDKDTIIKLRDEGLSFGKIGKRYGVHRSAIFGALHDKRRTAKTRPRPHRDAIINYIQQYHDEVGFSPTIADIADALGLGRSTVFYHLQGLEIEGRIERKARSPRGIRIL